MFRKTIKDTTTVTLGTLVSRLLGFVRDVLVAKFFGTSGLLEAFIVAFRLPNLFRSIFAEGFADSVATPVLSEYREQKDKLFEIGNHLLSIFMVVLLVFTFLGIALSKYLVLIMAPGFIAFPVKFELAVSFTRITFIYLFLIGLSVNSTAILCALKRFFVFAINPAFLNISFIIGIIFFQRYLHNYILVACVLAAGLLQTIFPFISLKKEGFNLRFSLGRAFKDSAVMRMVKLFIPRIWSSAVYHLSVWIDTVFSSLTSIVGAGALAAIYYGNRLIQFPFALIALSISRVAIVDLSVYHKEGKTEDFKNLFVFSFQNIIFFIVPVCFLFMFLSQAILDVLFKRGAFDAESLKITSAVLFFYSFGLFFFCTVKLLVHSFYSLKDTVTPAKTATISLVVNAALSAALMFPLKIAGVALGSSLAALFNCVLLYRALIRKIGPLDWKDTKKQLIEIVVLSITLGIVSRILWQVLVYSKYLKLGIIALIWFGVFYVVGNYLGFKQIRYAKELILKRKNKWRNLKKK